MKPQVVGSNPDKGYIPYILYWRPYQKSTYFPKKLFRDTPLVKSNEPTGSGFEFEHMICFLTFYTKIHFFKHQKELRPMSISSHSVVPAQAVPGLFVMFRPITNRVLFLLYL